MTNLTVYALMGEDHVEIGIVNENQTLVYAEKSHIFAWDAMVSFAKQIIACDARIQQEIEAND